MNVVIVGAGEVGTYLAERLSREDHNITVIDPDERRIRALGEYLDVLALQGNGATAQMQERADIRKVDLLIAVTNLDEVNMIACLMAHFYRVPRKIARVSNPEYFSTRPGGITPQAMGIDLVIHPERLCAQTLSSLLVSEAITELQEFADGKVRLVALVIGPENPWIGRPLVELADEPLFAHGRVVVVHRGEETIIPRGNDVLHAGDEIFLTAAAADADQLLHRSGVKRTVKLVVIAGGGQIGAELATILEAQGVEVRIIDHDVSRCERLSARLKHAVIFHGDCTNLKVLQNAGLEAADAFVVVTGDDETNILTAILGHQHGAHRTMALVTKAEYVPLVNRVPGVDVAISPRLATANEILRLVRRGRIHSVATLRTVEAEVLEFEAVENSKAVSAALKDVHFPRGAVVGSIVRDGLVIHPTGDARIAPRDHVIVFALSQAIPEVERFFARKRFALS